MICATIAKETNLELRNSWEAAASAGVRLVELRLDYLSEPVDWKRLLRDKPTQVLVTVRRPIDGGRWSGTESHRQALIIQATENGADWVDVEVDIAQSLTRTGISRRVVSFHDMNRTPENLDEIAQHCTAGDADLVKLAVMAKNVRDAFRLLDTVRTINMHHPAMGLSMGDFGQFTRVANALVGTNWTYATWDSTTAPAPGMLSFDQLNQVYDYEHVDSTMKLFAVIGDPISHSKSPLIHNLAFRHGKFPALYVPIRVAAEDLDWFMSNLAKNRIHGLSVTIPHKKRIIPYLTQADDLVNLTNSCNTVICPVENNANGHLLSGYNTDLEAALNSLTELLRNTVTSGGLAGQKVLLLGAGGVARSLAFGLNHHGAVVTIVNRTRSRADQLASETKCQSAEWSERNHLASQSDIIINATSLGMAPEISQSPLDAKAFQPNHIVFDTIYTPEWTTFLKQARSAGAVTLSGVDMFIRQAVAQSRYFTNGLEPPVGEMANSLRATL